MPSGRSLFKRIQQLLDGPGALGSGDNAKVLAWNNSTQRFEMVAQSGGGTPGGSTTQVQYNNAGVFAGDAGMTYDAANDALILVGRLVAPIWRPASDGTAALKIKTAADVDFVTFDTTNRRLILPNSVFYYGTATGGGFVPLIGLDSGNNILFGKASYGGSMYLYAGALGGHISLVDHTQSNINAQFVSDGSGYLARNTLAWSVAGIVDFKGTMGDSTKVVGTDAPIDWIEIKKAGATRYIPIYAA